MNNIVTLKTA